MEIIQAFGGVFLLIIVAGFIVAFSEKSECKEQRGQEPPRVIVTQQVPSVFDQITSPEDVKGAYKSAAKGKHYQQNHRR